MMKAVGGLHERAQHIATLHPQFWRDDIGQLVQEIDMVLSPSNGHYPLAMSRPFAITITLNQPCPRRQQTALDCGVAEKSLHIDDGMPSIVHIFPSFSSLSV